MVKQQRKLTKNNKNKEKTGFNENGTCFYRSFYIYIYLYFVFSFALLLCFDDKSHLLVNSAYHIQVQFYVVGIRHLLLYAVRLIQHCNCSRVEFIFYPSSFMMIPNATSHHRIKWHSALLPLFV